VGLYQFFKDKFSTEHKLYDLIPALLWRKPSLTGEKKYLKTIYSCHLCAGTLDGGDIDGDPCQRHSGAGGELTVLDIDHIIA